MRAVIGSCVLAAVAFGLLTYLGAPSALVEWQAPQGAPSSSTTTASPPSTSTAYQGSWLQIDANSFFWFIVGVSVAVIIPIIMYALRRLTLVTILWVITAWSGGTGLLLVNFGIYYATIGVAEGGMLVGVGGTMLGLAGIYATAATLKQQESQSSDLPRVLAALQQQAELLSEIKKRLRS